MFVSMNKQLQVEKVIELLLRIHALFALYKIM